jgi:hypothetical protein
MTRVGAAEGCDLLILIFKIKVKRSQPSAAPTGLRVAPVNPRAHLRNNIVYHCYKFLQCDSEEPCE